MNEVFEQERSARWNNRMRSFEGRLDQAVTEGKLTVAQKQKILEKKDELQAERETYQQEIKEELQLWLKENNIDPNILASYFG